MNPPDNPPANESVSPAQPTPDRVHSLDVLRGIDMFWIIGGSDVLAAATAGVAVPWVRTAVESLTNHVEWEGFHLHDGIFPLFLFLIGATLPWSIGRRVEQGVPKRQIVGKIVGRTAVLTLLGLVVNGILELPGWDNVRLFGVLQRQAAGYCGAALLFVFASVRTQAIVAVGCTALYALLLHALPMPGSVPGSYAEPTNVAFAFDRWLLQPGQIYTEFGDPEGPLAHLPGVSTALMGLLAGTFLKRSPHPGVRKALLLSAAGVALYAAGWLLHPVSPVIKKIWSPSFVLVSGGLSAVLLAATYLVCDVWKWRRGSGFWAVIGANAIAAYMVVHLVDFGESANRVFGGIAARIPGHKETVLAGGAFALVWLLLWAMQRHKMFLRV